jgi:MFS family permease
MAAAPTIVVAVIGAAVGGVGNGVWSISSTTALQEYTSRRWMALVMSLSQSIVQAAPGIGILLGGAISELYNPRVALAVGAGGSLVFAFMAWVALRPAAIGKPPVEPDEVKQPTGADTFAPAAT